MRRSVLPLLALAVSSMLGSACAGEQDGVPEGTPNEVVTGSASVTRELAPVRVDIAEAGEVQSVVSDLRTDDLGALLDAMDRIVRIRSFGGQQIRGVPVFRYDVVYRGLGGDEERLAVWVDKQRRIYRVQQRADDPREIPGAEVGDGGPLVNYEIVEFETRSAG